jgi:hypothetical protein
MGRRRACACACCFMRGTAEARMEHELSFHVEMEAERLVREQG